MQEQPQPQQYPQYPQGSQPLQEPQQPQYPPPFPPQYAQQSPYPQYPQPPQYAQQPMYAAPPQPMYAVPPQPVYYRSTSFTNKAVLTFFLYWLAYIPGLIFNIMYLNEANNVKKEIGRSPEGMGCLWATLIGSLVPLVAIIAFCALIGVFGALSGQH